MSFYDCRAGRNACPATGGIITDQPKGKKHCPDLLLVKTLNWPEISKVGAQAWSAAEASLADFSQTEV